MAAEMKGSAFNAMLLGTKKVAGSRWETLLSALEPDVRWHCTRPIVSGEWLPIALPQALRATAYEVVFDRDLGKTFAVGYEAFREQNSRIFRIAFRLMSREFVIGKLAMVWHGSYRDHGSVALVSSSAKHAEIAFTAVPSGNDVYWAGKAGVLKAAAEAIGGKHVDSRVLSSNGQDAVIRADWR